MKIPHGFCIKKLGINDFDHVAKFFLSNYSIKDVVYGKIPGIRSEDINRFTSARVAAGLKQDHTFGIFEEASSKLVAACCGCENTKYVPQLFKDMNSLSDLLQTILRFRDEMEHDVLDKLNTDKVIDLGIVSVLRDYRNHGFFDILEQKSVELAKKAGCSYAYALPTTEYLIRKNTRYFVLKEIKFSDYVDRVTGEKPFATAQFPFIRAQLLCLKL